MRGSHQDNKVRLFYCELLRVNIFLSVCYRDSHTNPNIFFPLPAWAACGATESVVDMTKICIYNPGQSCWDNSRFSPSPHYNVDISRSPKSRSVHRSLARFNIVWVVVGGGGRGRSERSTRLAHITMEACTVTSVLFTQNVTRVPKSFDPDCRFRQ